MRLKSIVFAWLCSIATLYAGASPYLGFALGGVAAEDSSFTYENGAFSESGELESGGGAVLEAAFGIDFDTVPFRLEAALSVLFNELDSITPDSLGGGVSFSLEDSGMAVTAFMINGYFDFPTGTFVEPYLFGGIGRATVFHELNDEDVDDNVAAAQIGAGMGFELTEFFLLDLKYRYFVTDDYTVSHRSESLEAEFASHQFLCGCRIRF